MTVITIKMCCTKNQTLVTQYIYAYLRMRTQSRFNCFKKHIFVILFFDFKKSAHLDNK